MLFLCRFIFVPQEEKISKGCGLAASDRLIVIRIVKRVVLDFLSHVADIEKIGYIQNSEARTARDFLSADSVVYVI